MNIMKKLLIGIFAMLFAVSCTNDQKGEATVRFFLTDAPASYDEVLLNVVDVQYHIENEVAGDMDNDMEEDSTSDGEWVSIDFVNDGVYNLLDFTNGVDTLLAEASIPEGKLTQIRLILEETGNQIMVDSMYYDLKVPSAYTSGLKINVNQTLREGVVYEMWIDFDAARSVVKTGNGKYMLKPVIRMYTESISGAMSGVIRPVESRPYIMSISQDLDTVATYADTSTGEFLIGGLANGSYVVVVEPDSGFSPVTVDDVPVYVGEVTVMDTIFVEEE